MVAKKSSKKKPVKKKNLGGRPTLYKPEYCEQARKLCLLGYVDVELADFFGVSEETIYEWQRRHKEFSESIKRGKAPADAKVAESLYHRALGYHHPDTHVSNFQGDITLTPITKNYPPDTGAAIIWLKNRQPKKWRDRIEHTGEDGGPMVVKLSREDELL